MWGASAPPTTGIFGNRSRPVLGQWGTPRSVRWSIAVLQSIRRLLLICCVVSLVGASLTKTPTAQAASFLVTTISDAPHSTPIDGACTSTLPDQACTLRAAIQAASFLGGTQSIDLQAAGVYALTVTGAN